MTGTDFPDASLDLVHLDRKQRPVDNMPALILTRCDAWLHVRRHPKNLANDPQAATCLQCITTTEFKI